MTQTPDYGKILTSVLRAIQPLKNPEVKRECMRHLLDAIQEELDEGWAAPRQDVAVSIDLTSDIVQIQSLWNVSGQLVRCARLPETRRAKIAARLKTYPDISDWATVIEWLSRQDWATGQTDRKWRADLPWLIKSDDHFQAQLDKARAPQAAGAPEKPDILDALEPGPPSTYGKEWRPIGE